VNTATTGPEAAGPPPGRPQAISRPRTFAARRLRVLLKADQHLVGEAVRMVLESNGLRVVTAGPLRTPLDPAARRALASERLQVALLIGEFEEPERLDEALALVAAVPLPWLALVQDPAAVRWGALADAGVAGILPTSMALDRLLVTMSRVLAGHPMMSERARLERVRRWRDQLASEQHAVALVERLTPRERSVAALLNEGLGVSEIAELTGVSPLTVRTQVKTVLRKLEVTSQLAAVAAFRRGTGRP
jgi:DNA-binding NarL/FixJ family response regulator